MWQHVRDNVEQNHSDVGPAASAICAFGVWRQRLLFGPQRVRPIQPFHIKDVLYLLPGAFVNRKKRYTMTLNTNEQSRHELEE